MQELGRLRCSGKAAFVWNDRGISKEALGFQSMDELPVLSPVQVEEFKQEAEEEMHVKLDV